MSFPKTYRAYQYENYGPIEKELTINSNLSQLPLNPQQVRIKVHSAAVNPIDYKLIEFMGQVMLGKAPSKEQPFNVGFDAAGEVVEVGRNVERLKVGDAVYTTTSPTSIGTLAEYLVIDEELVALKPRNLNFNEAAAVASVAITAYTGMTTFSNLQKGETILILGGSSAVGMLAIQFAHDIGARVVTTTSTRNVELVTSLGADQVIDYTKDKWLDVLVAHSIDVVYDCGVEPAAWNDGAQSVLKKNTGRFITLLPMSKPVKESEFGAQLIGYVSSPAKSFKTLDAITEYIESEKVKPVIDSVYPFEKALDAYAKLKIGHAQGKLVVQVHP
ncbi:Alcohol dehydrogenase [Phytophthora palmivora]|uniref:Alcohol dehydrogenase n=1 Tax=Phytophthora palmivora TaxID=4796 RepID=A0A2P4XIW5_9STRA|nr:Alcohol dehydrogenase [Phytophthora palmivora]